MHYDLYTVLESIVWLYRCLGCYPFVIRKSNESRKYALSTIAVTFSILFFLINVKIFFDYANMITTTYSLGDDSLSVLILFVRQISSAVCLFDATIMKIVYSKKIITSVDNLSMQDKFLKDLGHTFNYKTAVIASPLSIIPFLIFTYSLLNTEFVLFVDIPITTYLRVFGNTTVFVQVINITLFAFLIINVGYRFKALNNCIENLINAEKEKSHISNTEESLLNMFCISAKVHAKLSETAKNFNVIFVLTIIASVIKAFVLSTSMLYYIFISLKYGSDQYSISTLLLFFSILTVNVIIVIIVVFICNWTSTQAIATTKILHKVSLEKFCIEDEQLNEMVRSFLMQIVHHNPGFSAAGLFPIDSTLLQSLAGAITTYLVILIQFDPKIK